MKKRSLVQKAPRSLSPAERIPADIGRQIFSYLDLKELARIAPVSKFWDEQIRHDPRWRELYVKECNELYRLFNNKIPPHLIRKKYFEYKRIIGKIRSNNQRLIEETEKLEVGDPWRNMRTPETEKFIKLFKNAVKKNALEVVHFLLKDNLLNIDITFKYNAWYNGGCSNSTLVYYAARKGSFEMVKLLLLHGADVTKEVIWWYTSARSNGPSTYTTKHTILGDLSVLSQSLKSLVCIGYAEHFLFKNDFETATNYFEKSNNYDPKVISDYIQQVHQDKMGFKLNYDESLINRLNTCFEPILNKVNEKHCIIS